MTVTEAPPAAARADAPQGGGRLGSGWVVGGLAVLLLLILAWPFLKDPSLSAPTRDPAWYTWRANVIMDSDPASVVGEWGPEGLFAGGYRVTTPLAGALLQRVAGIDTYSFSAFLMIGIPILTALALGIGAFRSRGDPIAILVTMLATVALFLTTPYVGYLDNITVLFLLSLTLPFLHAARTSWGARSALFLIGVAAAFTHPTTCVIFGVVLMAVFGWHFLTSRFSLGSALKADGPMLMSVGFGMIVGLASWLVGIWGQSASLAEAALPPPYTKAFFTDRLVEWVVSLQPVIIVPYIAIAIVSTILLARRTREPAHTYDLASIGWMLAFVGALSVFTSAVVPYYRFMNASAAPMALAGLGAFVAIRWFLRLPGRARIAGVLGAVLVVGSLGWVLYDGLQHRWVTEKNQWANQDVRTSLTAVHEIVGEAGERPIVLVVNYNDGDDETGTNTAYGWAKTYTNVFRTGLNGDDARLQATFLGAVDDLRAGQASVGRSEGYTEAASQHFEELQTRMEDYPEDPLVFLIGQYYGGLCNGVEECDEATEQERFEAAIADAVEVGPDTYVLTGDGFYAPSDASVAAAQEASQAEGARLEDHPGPLADPLHQLRVLLGLAVLALIPGLIAAPWFELRGGATRVALVPAMSIVLTLLGGIAVLAVWRGPLTTAKAWTVVGVTIAAAAGLRYGAPALLRVLNAFGGFFNNLFSVFSNRDYAVLMGVQFLAQAGQGVVQGAIAKSIAFGGQEGFDIQTVPSADYLLKVVLALYVPYMLISPFIGVFIDRFQRRRVAWWANSIASALVVVVAFVVLLPLGSGTSEGRLGATAGLIIGLLVVQSVARIVLAIKSAAIPDVLAGKDLLQGNGLSQAGGGLLQIVGIAFGGVAAGIAPPWIVVMVGAGVLLIAAIVSRQMHHVEAAPHDTSFAREASAVIRNIGAGLRELAARPAAALGLSGFQMLRYQFWGFCLFTWALYGKNLVKGGDADTLSLVLSGVGGMLGGALGVVVAQKLKDRVPPVRILLVSMLALGAGVVLFGSLVSVPGFAALLFLGFFTFFTGKISADTIVQQTMPDDFRGRAFALFDIAYNLGYIVPALILSLVWIEDDAARTRAILVVSGAVFLGLTMLLIAWARRIREQFAPQDDLVETSA
jgi:hypothetical protein